jgi:predicted transcriptional regulator
MTILAHILNSKPDHTVYTTTPTTSVFDAVKLMAEKSIGALVVTEGERVAGMVTERDYARKIVLMARSSKETAVRDIMTTSVMYVRPDQTSEECMALMTEHRLRHLPVLDKGKLIGLISIGDLVKDIISEQKFTIQQLEHYISGEHGLAPVPIFGNGWVSRKRTPASPETARVPPHDDVPANSPAIDRSRVGGIGLMAHDRCMKAEPWDRR